MTVINLPSSFFLKESIRIALEISFPDISLKQSEQIRDFINSLSCNNNVSITKETKESLLFSIRYLKCSSTWSWLREDLRNEIIDLEKQLH